MRHFPGDAQPCAGPAAPFRAGLALAATLALSTAWTGVAHAQYAARATPVSSADGSHPFNSAAFARIPQNLASVGYAEKEYFLGGLARAYGYTNPSSTTDDSVAPVQTAPVSYVNRILVRAPTSAARFSGNVIVEIANDALISDNETAWPYANSQFISNGDAYILLTSQPAGLQTLKASNATRYRALNWPTVAATRNACNAGPEAGIIYDQITELGNLLRSNASGSPLAGYGVRHLFLTGYSAGASILLTYDRVFALNSPLYDGYFVAAGGFRNALNGCEASSASTGRTQPPASSVSAVFQTQTESELDLAYLSTNPPGSTPIPSSADSNTANNRYRYYEIAGASHVNGDLLEHSPQRSDFPSIPGVNYLADVTQTNLRSECNEPGNSFISSFPNRYVYDAMWANLEHWVTAGTAYSPPVETSRIDIPLYIVTQIQSGGVRSPAVDDPLQAYTAGTALPSTAASALRTFCGLTGYQVANGQALSAANVTGDAAALATAGFMTSADAAAITANPSLAYTFPDGTSTVPDNPP